MATLSKEQMQQLNQDLKNGTILATIHNSRYHLIIKVNPEGILVQSMLAEDNDMGIVFNCADIRESFNLKNLEKNGQSEENSQSSSENM